MIFADGPDPYVWTEERGPDVIQRRPDEGRPEARAAGHAGGFAGQEERSPGLPDIIPGRLSVYSTTLYVGNLKFGVTRGDIANVFQQVGQVTGLNFCPNYDIFIPSPISKLYFSPRYSENILFPIFSPLPPYIRVFL